MAQPTPYVPSFDFSDFSTLNPDTPQPGVSLDAQFNAIKLTTDETLANLELIQRDDGLLANGIVTPDSLSDELYAGISRAIPWATATAYEAGDLVWYLSILYSANSDHTSTTNPTVDTTKWTVILNMTVTVPDVITQNAEDAADAAAASAVAAAASAAGIANLVSSVQYLWAGTATGAANTLVLAPVPTMASYAVGHKLRFVVGTTNTGTTTMNTDNALGSVTIKKIIGGALVNLVAGDLVAGTIAEIEYISGVAGYQLLNPATYSQGASVASATTVNLDTATGDYVSITGTTTITGITLAQGRERTVTFAAALTLTHGASLLLKNAGANIVTAAGDSAVFRGEASGVVRMISYTAASGQAVAPPTPATIAEVVAADPVVVDATILREYVSPWVAYTPTITGFGTPTGVAFYSRRNGDSLEVRGKWASGTSTGVEARVTLGHNGTNNNVTTDSAKMPTGASCAGACTVGISGATFFGASVLCEGGVGYLTFGRQTSAVGSTAKTNADTIAASGNGVSFYAVVPITGW